MLQDKEEMGATHLKRDIIFELQIGQPEGEGLKERIKEEKIQAEEEGEGEGELKSDGLSSLGQPATVKAVIYSAIISVDI